MTHARYTERDREICRLKDEGLTYREIGERYGISRARAHDIVRDHVAGRDPGTRARERVVRDAAIIRYRADGLSTRQIGRLLRLSATRVGQICSRHREEGER